MTTPTRPTDAEMDRFASDVIGIENNQELRSYWLGIQAPTFIALARAWLERRKRERWQPIETAPKDGKSILLCVSRTSENKFFPDHQYVTGGVWQDGMWDDGNGFNLENPSWMVTHWMPIPSPPAAEPASEPAATPAPANDAAGLSVPPMFTAITESDIAKELIVLHRAASPVLADACERLLGRIAALEAERDHLLEVNRYQEIAGTATLDRLEQIKEEQAKEIETLTKTLAGARRAIDEALGLKDESDRRVAVLEADKEKLRTALEPFAKMDRDGECLGEIACERGTGHEKTILTSQDFRNANAALEQTK